MICKIIDLFNVHSTVTMKMVLPTSNSQYIKGLVKVISRLSDAFALKPISFFWLLQFNKFNLIERALELYL